MADPNDPNNSFAAWLAANMTPAQAAASSGPVTQAPTNTYNAQNPTNGQNLSKKNGPWDKFRGQVPPDVSPEWWNAFLDTQNYTYEQGTTADKDKVNSYVSSASPDQVTTLAKGMSVAQLQNKSGGYAPTTTYQQAPRVATGATAAPQFQPQADTLHGGIQGVNQQVADAQNANWNKTVAPAYQGQVQAVADQRSGNRDAESEVAAGGLGYRRDLAQTQAQRAAGTAAANAEQTQTLNTFKGANAASNAAQQGNVNALSSSLNDYNNQQTSANNKVQGQLGGLTTQASGLANTLDSQVATINNQDRASYVRYLQQTNPLLAAQIAQGSSAEFVGNQKDQLAKYNALSTPQVTGQERLLAELARRKAEADDKSSRDATFQQMQARGSNSAGQQIAAQYAARANTSSDRVLAELGLQGSAVGRSMDALAGATGVANQLRNADDSMRNFQDTYAQNDALRRQGVAQGQADTGLKTTKQLSDRDFGAADFGRNVVNDNTDRAQLGFNDTTTTLGANTGRDTTKYDARTQTVQNNSARDQADFDGGTKTTEDNSDRDQYSWDSADHTAGETYGTYKDHAGMVVGDRAAEVGSASGLTGSSLGVAGGFNDMSGTQGAAKKDAMTQAFADWVALNTPKPEDDEN